MDVDVDVDVLKTEGDDIEPPEVLITYVLDILKELSKLSGGDSICDLECPPPLAPFHDISIKNLHAIEVTGTAFQNSAIHTCYHAELLYY